MTKLDECYDLLARAKGGYISVMALQNLLNLRYDELGYILEDLRSKGLVVELIVGHITLYKQNNNGTYPERI
jgi:hypothetical protein